MVQPAGGYRFRLEALLQRMWWGFVCLMLGEFATAQPQWPDTHWTRVYGSLAINFALAVTQWSDGGYGVVGLSRVQDSPERRWIVRCMMHR